MERKVNILLAISLIIFSWMLILFSTMQKQKPKTAEYWAIEAVKEEYLESVYGDYGFLGYTINEITITGDGNDIDSNQRGYGYKAYAVMILDDSGKSHYYNVWIDFRTTAFDDYFGARKIKEENIVDIDIEEAHRG